MIQTKSRYITSIVVLAVFLLTLGLLSTFRVKATADICTWTGDVDNTWLTAGNWNCSVDGADVPEDGDSLVFPDDASNKNIGWNAEPGEQFNNVTISGDSYSLSYGDQNIFLEGTLTISGDNNTITTNIIFAHQDEAAFVNTGENTNFTEWLYLWPSVAGTEFTFNIERDLSIDVIEGNSNALNTIYKAGEATLSVGGTDNDSYAATNGIDIIAGTWQCDGEGCLGDDTNEVIIEEGGSTAASVLYLNSTDLILPNPIIIASTSGDPGVIKASEDTTLSGELILMTDGVFEADAGSTLTITGTVDVGSGQDLIYDGVSGIDQTGTVSGGGNIVVNTNRVTFRANNTYTGITTIKDDAELELRSNGVLGTTAGGTIIEDGAQLTVTSVSGDKTYGEPLTVAGSGEDEGAITNADADDDITFSGPITLNGNTTVHNVFNDSTLSLSGIISGSGNLTIGGNTGNTAPYALGSFDTGGSPNTFDGDVIVNGSSLSLAKDGAVPRNLFITATSTNSASAGNFPTGALDLISDNGVVTLTKNGARTATLNYGGMANEETIGGLSGDGTVFMNDNIGTQTLTLNVSDSQSFTGSLTANILNKAGSGTQTLGGEMTVDTINVDSGSLIITSATTAEFNVVAGSILKGNGEIGNATVAGTLAPGLSPGIITINGDLDLTNGTLEAELDGTTVGSQYDQTVVTGTAILSNTTLNIDLGFTPTVGNTFTILRAATINGQFNGLADGSSMTINGTTFRINYNPSTGGEDTVTLTVLSTNGAGTPNTGLLRQSMLIYSLALIVGTGLILSQIKPLRRFVNATMKKLI